MNSIVRNFCVEIITNIINSHIALTQQNRVEKNWLQSSNLIKFKIIYNPFKINENGFIAFFCFASCKTFHEFLELSKA